MNPVLHKLKRRAESTGTLLCVGLDPDLGKLPRRFRDKDDPQFAFNRWIIEQTYTFALAYKLNTAFYEARGTRGIDELHRTLELLHSDHPSVVTVCDSKRADIGNTNLGYAHFAFDWLRCDAITLHPYLGREALAPFLEREDKASIILCRTSNPGAGELQDLQCNGRPLWQIVAEKVSAEWNERGNCMLVVGATYPDEMRIIRSLAPEITLLVPGLGAQGGDAAAVVAAGLDASGSGLLLNSSRGIIFSDDPGAAARALRDEINTARGVTVANEAPDAAR